MHFVPKNEQVVQPAAAADSAVLKWLQWKGGAPPPAGRTARKNLQQEVRTVYAGRRVHRHINNCKEETEHEEEGR